MGFLRATFLDYLFYPYRKTALFIKWVPGMQDLGLGTLDGVECFMIGRMKMLLGWRMFWSIRLRKEIVLMLKTGEFLLGKGIIDHQQTLCPLCNLEVESNAHILFTCRFSWGTWMKMLEWWGLVGVLQNQCESFIVAWSGLMKYRKWKKLWNLVLVSCFGLCGMRETNLKSIRPPGFP